MLHRGQTTYKQCAVCWGEHLFLGLGTALSIQLKSEFIWIIELFALSSQGWVLYEKVFIATESPAATSGLPHASLPQARPLPPLFCTRLMKSLSEGETDAVDHWLTISASDWICFRLMTLMGWGHDGSLLLLIMGTDYDSDQRWSLHAACSEASWGSNVSWQRESRRTSCMARLLSLHMTYSLSRQVKA